MSKDFNGPKILLIKSLIIIVQYTGAKVVYNQ